MERAALYSLRAVEAFDEMEKARQEEARAAEAKKEAGTSATERKEAENSKEGAASGGGAEEGKRAETGGKEAGGAWRGWEGGDGNEDRIRHELMSALYWQSLNFATIVGVQNSI
eukprot:2236698-Rhodomonas_salina.2